MSAAETEPLTIAHLWDLVETGEDPGHRLVINRHLAPDEWDDRAVEVLAVHGLACQLVLDIDEAIEANDPRLEPLSQSDVDFLTHCTEFGEHVTGGGDEVLHDIETLGEDVLEGIRVSLVALGEAYGADMTMDAPSEAELDRLKAHYRPSYGRAG